jgi:polysaccharide pyruvyl transferase WcaK-like protein
MTSKNSSSRYVRKIAIFGHYGHENLGDEAIILACIQRYADTIPEAEIVLFSSQPADSSARYSLPAYPIEYFPKDTLTSSEQLDRERDFGVDHTGASATGDRPEPTVKRALKRIPLLWSTLRFIKNIPNRLLRLYHEIGFLRDSRKTLKGIDLLVVTGSNQFLDNFGGPTGFPLTLFKWAWLARSVNVPVAYVSVGAGPLDAPLSHKLIRAALRSATYLSFRDDASRQLVDPKNKFGGHVYPDLALGIDKPPTALETGSNDLIIAINPMAVYDARYWYIKDTEKYQSYVNRMTELTEQILESKFTPKLFATQPKDENVIRDIIEKMIERGHSKSVSEAMFQPLKTVNELLAFLQHAHAIIPTRFHGTVLGLWAEKPTIGICYYRKAADILTEFGQGEYAFELDDFSPNDVFGGLTRATDDYDAITAQIRANKNSCRALLEEQFGKIRGLVDLPVSKQ